MAETYKTLGTLIYRDDGSAINKNTAANLDARHRELAAQADAAMAEARRPQYADNGDGTGTLLLSSTITDNGDGTGTIGA